MSNHIRNIINKINIEMNDLVVFEHETIELKFIINEEYIIKFRGQPVVAFCVRNNLIKWVHSSSYPANTLVNTKASEKKAMLDIEIFKRAL